MWWWAIITAPRNSVQKDPSSSEELEPRANVSFKLSETKFRGIRYLKIPCEALSHFANLTLQSTLGHLS